jgi:TPR repeat protein
VVGDWKMTPEEISFPDLVRLAEEERNLYALRVTAPILFESDEESLKAVKFYEILALEFDEAEAMMFLSWYFKDDPQISLEWLKKAANLNYTPAVVRMAQSYQSKFPLADLSACNAAEEEEEFEALEHYSSLAAQIGNSASCFYLGKVNEHGYFSCPKSKEKALEFYLLGSDSRCILHASNILMNDKEESKALELIATSARKYGTPPLKLVADMFVEKDPQEALKLYQESSNQGDVLSTKILGDCYYYGIGTESNTDNALEYYEKAISLGYNEAALPCIRIYLEKREKSKAIELLQKLYKGQEINLDNF